MSNTNKNASGQQNQDWDNKNQTGKNDDASKREASQQGRMDKNEKSSTGNR